VKTHVLGGGRARSICFWEISKGLVEEGGCDTRLFVKGVDAPKDFRRRQVVGSEADKRDREIKSNCEIALITREMQGRCGHRKSTDRALKYENGLLLGLFLEKWVLNLAKFRAESFYGPSLRTTF